MQKDKNEISEAELEIMKILWANKKSMNAQEVCDTLVNRKWTYSTISTLFSRMVEKGAVTYEKRGRFYYYSPAIGEDTYRQAQTKKLVSKLYDGSVKNLAVSLVRTGELSENDIEDIKKAFTL